MFNGTASKADWMVLYFALPSAATVKEAGWANTLLKRKQPIMEENIISSVSISES